APPLTTQQLAVVQPGTSLLERLSRPRVPGERLGEGVPGGLLVLGEQAAAARRNRDLRWPLGPRRLDGHYFAHSPCPLLLSHAVKRLDQVSGPVQQDRIAEPVTGREGGYKVQVPDGRAGVAGAQLEQRESDGRVRLNHGRTGLVPQDDRTRGMLLAASGP